MNGEFPILKPSQNAIIWSGDVTTIEVKTAGDFYSGLLLTIECVLLLHQSGTSIPGLSDLFTRNIISMLELVEDQRVQL